MMAMLCLHPFFLFFFLLLCTTITNNVSALSLRSSSSSSSSVPIPQNNNNVVAEEGITTTTKDYTNRRKSPALWRNDLVEDDDDDEHGLTTQQQNHRKEQQRLMMTSPPEVMSPVGGWSQLHAAIANGADSIYLGLSAFSARARATNFDPIDELPQAVSICHQHNVRVYVALNTLVFDNELDEIEDLIKCCITANVDALIIQDIGIAKLAQRIINSSGNNHNHNHHHHQLEIHASTQQTVTSADGAAFCYELMGTPRVVLGRELSTTEIDHVSKHLPPLLGNDDNDNDDDELEIEVFVHGALCVSYSGQCFSSEAWGGRSANRGQCAQACRLPYGLIDNGQLIDLQDFSYLLSPQDLCGLDQVPNLIEANVSCLKIEGRLKDSAYVAATTRAYRMAVDQGWDDYCMKHNIPNNHFHRKIISEPGIEISRQELAQVFSRGQDENNNGLTPGFLEGSKHQRLVQGRSPRHRGVHVGRVIEGSNYKRGLLIVSDVDDNNDDDGDDDTLLLKPGDGIVVDRGMAQEEELGGAIYDIEHHYRFDNGDDHDRRRKKKKGSSNNNGNDRTQQGRRQQRRITTIHFSRDTHNKWKKYDDNVSRFQHNDDGGGGTTTILAPVGAHVWKTSDSVVDKKLKRLSEAPPPKGVATIAVTGRIGQPLEIRICDVATGLIGIGQTSGELEPAEGSGLSRKSIIKAIGKLGNTQWLIDVNDDDDHRHHQQEAAIDTNSLEDGVWCPVSWIKEARRIAVEDLESKVCSTSKEDQKDRDKEDPTTTTASPLSFNTVSEMLDEAYKGDGATKEIDEARSVKAKLSVLARNYEQVDRLCEMIEGDDDETKDIDEIIVDFLEVDGMREAVERIRQVNDDAGKKNVRVVVASPRIIKPEESGIWRTLLQLQPDGLLVRSTGLLYRMMELGGAGTDIEIKSNGKIHKVTVPELIGDFSLNVANALTAWELLKYGCSRVTASFDLASNAITELLETLGSTNAGKVEVIAHTHLPIFHTEHCVFARFLTKGNSYVDCGHACTRHNIHLRDPTGADNLVLADMGCRNTVFSATAQSGVHSLKEWMSVGGERFRIELVDESPDDVELIVNGYIDVLNGDAKPKEVWMALEEVRDSNGRKGGVSHGSLRNQVERRAGEII